MFRSGIRTQACVLILAATSCLRHTPGSMHAAPGRLEPEVIDLPGDEDVVSARMLEQGVETRWRPVDRDTAVRILRLVRGATAWAHDAADGFVDPAAPECWLEVETGSGRVVEIEFCGGWDTVALRRGPCYDVPAGNWKTLAWLMDGLLLFGRAPDERDAKGSGAERE